MTTTIPMMYGRYAVKKEKSMSPAGAGRPAEAIIDLPLEVSCARYGRWPFRRPRPRARPGPGPGPVRGHDAHRGQRHWLRDLRRALDHGRLRPDAGPAPRPVGAGRHLDPVRRP